MLASHIKALEIRSQWLRYALSYLKTVDEKNDLRKHYTQAMRTYTQSLYEGDSVFMNNRFCELVDFARRSVPDDLAFEESWMVTPAGFLWLEKPFECPLPKGAYDFSSRTNISLKKLQIHAVSWMPVARADGVKGVHFMCFNDYGTQDSCIQGFGAWSYFTLCEGDKMINRLRQFESLQGDLDLQRPEDGQYPQTRTTEVMHEIRWVYTAMHLMAQRLTHVSEKETSPMARTFAHRKGLTVAPRIKVIALRRMEEERPEGQTEHQAREWQWQWMVKGHWRNQWYATEQLHRQVFIEAYVKGPTDKPMKPVTPVLYKAVR